MLEIYAKDEFLRYIGARPYERTKKRKDYRNGSLHKTILTPTFPTFESCIRILYSLLRLQNENWEGKPIASL